MNTPNATAERRLLAKTKRQPNGCLLFTGATAHGYGRIWDGTKPVGAHRLSYAIFKGPIPDGYHVCHTCDTPSCVEVSHLFAAPQRVNLADMRAKGRGAQGPSLSDAIRAGWTPEVREKRGEQARAYLAEQREKAARDAGVPTHWKRCPGCDTWKDRAEFYRNAAREDGLKPYCKPCSREMDKESSKEYRARNRDLRNAKARAYHRERKARGY